MTAAWSGPVGVGGTESEPPVPAPRGRVPVVTTSVFVVTGTVTAAHLLAPDLLDALVRQPDALVAGEWWRLVTPLFGHDKGWTQIAINLAGIVAVGAPMERAFGGPRWLALYFVSGAVGQVAAHFWYPYGAGASTALIGLGGGLLVWLLRQGDGEEIPRVAAFFTLYFVASLVGRYAANLGIIGGDTGGAVVCCTLLGVLFGWFQRRYPSPRATALFVASASTLGAVALTALRDIHGPALLAGMALAAVLLRRAVTPRPEIPR